MKVAIMGMEPRGEWERLDDAEQNQRVRRHQEILDELVTARARTGPPGLIFASFGLGAEREAVTVRCERGDHACTDGPFPETKEVIGGFDIIEFATRQAAVDWIVGQPRHPSHVTEVRAIGELWWISGLVDRPRLMKVERWPETAGRSERPAAGELYSLTVVEGEHGAGHPGARLASAHRRICAEYVRQRSTIDHEPGLWVAARLGPSAEAATIRSSAGKRVASDGPPTAAENAIGGFDVIACASQDEAIAWARKLATRDGDVIEVRPVRGGGWVYHE